MNKKIFLALSLLVLTACENVKGPGGNQMITGSKTYYYALVYSHITETRYYQITGWAEYGPEGVYLTENGNIGNYVGLELQLVSGDVIYRYEPNLSYELSKNRNATYIANYGLIC